MQINHNIRAMVTQHSLFQNNNSMTKSLEKLSTGLRINRAQDDAAGLAMSEQMRSQIRGLGKAKANAQDGQAALQIAEGALGEISNMMQRQKELAVQSATDTLTVTERKYLNDEFQALTKEIDRIAKTTDYNGKNVLLYAPDANKSFGATKVQSFTADQIQEDMVALLQRYFGGNLDGAFSTLGSYTPAASTNAVNDSIKAINNAVGALNGILTKDNAVAALGAVLGAVSAYFQGGKGYEVTIDPKEATGFTITDNLSSSDLETVKKISQFTQEAQRLTTLNGVAGADAGVIWAAIVSENAFQDRTGPADGTLKAAATRITTALSAVTNKATENNMAAVFGSSASEQMKKDLSLFLNADISKMGTLAIGDKAKVLAWQNDLKDLQDIYRSSGTPGYAASDILHIGANYSTGLGGSAANEVKVNYSAVDVRGLGLQRQSIDTQKGAAKAIDNLDQNIKVISGNRAAIGTYINRLDYTVNNLASMEYNTQDAESRIRDTDFATETTSFTKNQIMVQSATSMLAQANMLPQSVLSLIG